MIKWGAELLNQVLIKSSADTNAQVEEFFWIKKRTTFRNVPRADLTEFIRDNNEDNFGMMRQFSDGLLVELEKVKGKSALSSMVKVAEEHLRENSKDEKDSDVEETYVPQPEEEWKDKKSKSNIGKRKRQRGEYQVPPDVPLLFDPTVPPIPEGSAPRSKNAFQEFKNKHWDNIAKEKRMIIMRYSELSRKCGMYQERKTLTEITKMSPNVIQRISQTFMNVLSVRQNRGEMKWYFVEFVSDGFMKNVVAFLLS